MTTHKHPKDMTLDELIEATRGITLTEEEKEEQALAIAASEARLSGDELATKETIRAAKLLIETYGETYGRRTNLPAQQLQSALL